MAVCRICFDNDTDEKKNPLLSPCSCKGSQKYVHRECLEKWLKVEPIKGLDCSVCKEPLATSTVYEQVIPRGSRVSIVLYPHVFLISESVLAFTVCESFYDYCMIHWFYCILYLGLFYEYFHVKNKMLYFKRWLDEKTLTLFSAHLFILSCWLLNPYIVVFLNSCMLNIYVHHHFFILDEMNKSMRIVFISKT
jgi:E3 ubiquitin-protein ligase DOA10